MKHSILLFFVITCISCTPHSVQELAEMEPENPTMVLEDASYRFLTNGIDPMILQAKSIVIDEKTHSTTFTHVNFLQEEEDGITGFSEKVTIDTQSRDVVLEGNVRISQPNGGFSISAEMISWNNEKQILQCDPDEVVQVVFDGKSTIKGDGFRGNLAESSYEFAHIEKGEVATQ